jgi:hypothetical protein
MFPKARDEWIALALFPFKAYVVVAFPFYILFDALTPRVFMEYSPTLTAIFFGYVLCVPILLFGALLQSIVCSRGAATRTVLVVVYCFLLHWFLHLR